MSEDLRGVVLMLEVEVVDRLVEAPSRRGRDRIDPEILVRTPLPEARPVLHRVEGVPGVDLQNGPRLPQRDAEDPLLPHRHVDLCVLGVRLVLVHGHPEGVGVRRHVRLGDQLLVQLWRQLVSDLVTRQLRRRDRRAHVRQLVPAQPRGVPARKEGQQVGLPPDLQQLDVVAPLAPVLARRVVVARVVEAVGVVRAAAEGRVAGGAGVHGPQAVAAGGDVEEREGVLGIQVLAVPVHVRVELQLDRGDAPRTHLDAPVGLIVVVLGVGQPRVGREAGDRAALRGIAPVPIRTARDRPADTVGVDGEELVRHVLGVGDHVRITPALGE